MSNLLFDYHLHSRHSPDGSMEMDTILKRAQELGLAEICITDHIEVDNSFGDEWESNSEIVTALLADLNRMQEMSDGYVKKGVELAFPDNDPGTVEDMIKLINPKDFDYAIVSLHQYNGESTFSENYFDERDLPQGQLIIFAGSMIGSEYSLWNISTVSGISILQLRDPTVMTIPPSVCHFLKKSYVSFSVI